MPHRRRTLIVEAPKPTTTSTPTPTPLRRSPRLQLQTNFSTQKNPNSRTPQKFSKDSDNKSRVPPTNSHKSASGTTRPSRKSLKGLKKSDGGSVNNGKSANGSPRKSKLNSKFESLEGIRKSPRLCKKVNYNPQSGPCSGGVWGDSDVTALPLRRLVPRDNVEMRDSPVTPVGMGEKKSRCSDLLKCSLGEFKGKERRSDCPEIIICGLASADGGQLGRQHDVQVNRRKGSKVGESCEVNARSFERMITRSASKSMREQDGSCRRIVEIGCTGSLRNVVKKAESKKTLKEVCEASGSLKTLASQPQKRVTRNSAVSSCIRPEGEMGSQGIDENGKGNDDCNTQVNCELKQERSDGRRTISNSREGENKTQKLIGNKRKRKQAGLQGADQGWTKEQEVALQRAYFAAKPSPRFWKRVSKLVPGKSAQDCFDKVHSDNLTPLSTRRSSRAKKGNSPSDLSISGCNLFKSPETKSKKMRKTKQKSHITRRTVRHLLQKYSKVNEDNESDLFSILEPTVNPSLEFLPKDATQSTPKHVLWSPGSSSKHKKYASRFRSASKSPLTSPPVLKKVKNMALHEKYIDQLHKREAKRKVQFSRYVKSVPCQKGEGDNPVAMKDVIRAAKDALISDARDAINKFRDSQTNIMDSFCDSEDEGLVDQDEDDGVVL